ncbi:TonB-dependent receptor [Novosphingobium sp. 9U]|uniref:TonB-dependent receptor n=1 Tax=Novosphingobium sp. 9U TaxID=2653158 RepID=UPI00135C8C76|nr:TonB-dependent receptor [Novosphingobium sp. 9U]
MSKVRQRVRCSRIVLALTLTASWTTSAAAQDVAQNNDQADTVDSLRNLDEIVVTATKREQNVNDVGISITALSAESLAKSGITDSTGITFSVPNLENAPVFGPGSNTNFSVRGVAQNDYNDGTESPIATYVDDVYLVPTGAGSFPLYDMQRVEVLRGPQGTLFGRNSTGGLIHFISAKPTDNFYASISGMYGSHDTKEITGVLNIPIVQDKVSLRIAGQYHDNDAWMNNLSGTQPDNGQLKTRSVRAILRLKPTDTITDDIKFSYDNAHGYTNGVFHQAVGIDAVTGNQFVLGANQDFYGTGPQRDSFGLANVEPGESDNGSVRRLNGTNSYLVSNTLNWDLGATTITSVTAYNHYHRDQIEDCDGLQPSICNTHYDNVSRQVTQELRSFTDLGGVRITGGVYYLWHKVNLRNFIPLLLNVPSVTFAQRVDGQQRSRSYAAFGNVEWDATPTITVIGGLRVSKDKKHFNQDLRFVLPADPANPFPNYWNTMALDIPYGDTIAQNLFDESTAGSLTRINKTTWSAKGEVDFKPTDRTLVYGSISRGIKSPGFNNGVISIGLTPEQYQFKTEVLTAYELGLKQEIGRIGNFNLSGFYYDYKNFDTLSFVGVASFTDNHDATLYGIEGDISLRPVEGLTLKLNGGLVHSKLQDVANAALVVADRDMPLAPSWSVGGSIRYELPIANGDYRLGLQADARARDSFYNNPGNDSAAKVPSMELVNARVDLADANDRFEVGVSVKNVFNKTYITSLFLLQGLGGYRYGQIGLPRWASLDVTVKFK